MNRTPERIYPVRFESFTEKLIRRAATKTKRVSGTSGMDADGWRRILASNSFGASNNDLRKAFANIVKKLCTHLIEVRYQTIKTFLSCKLSLYLYWIKISVLDQLMLEKF